MIMRVFIDTNIILDFFMRREGFETPEEFLSSQR